MNENYSQPILNPNVYLSYLQPSVAVDYEVARDVVLVTFGALLWDILSSLPDDWTLIRTTKPSPVLLAYFSTRTFALGVTILSILMKTGPIRNCNAMQLILNIFWILSSASSSYLFLKRIHAVFLDKRLACHAFTLFYIAQVGASTVLIPATLHAYYEIANTKHCLNVTIPSYVAVAFYVPVMFDVVLFTAMSIRIHKSHGLKIKPTSWRALFTGNLKALPHFTRAILQGGQQYYMITHGVNVTRANIAISTSISPVYQLLPLVPAVAVTSAMACRIFRKLKLEASKKTEVGNLTTIRFAEKERVNVHLPRDSGFTMEDADVERCSQ